MEEIDGIEDMIKRGYSQDFAERFCSACEEMAEVTERDFGDVYRQNLALLYHCNNYD